MAKNRSLRFALLAATSLATSGVAAAHAAPATESAAEVAAPFEHAAGDAEPAATSAAARAGLAALLAAAVAGLFSMKSVRRLLSRAAPAAAKAAEAVVRAPVMAAKAVGRAAASPFRFALLFGSLGLFALAGVGLYDVEWLAGLLVGLALAALSAHGAAGARRVLARRPQAKERYRSENFNQ